MRYVNMTKKLKLNKRNVAIIVVTAIIVLFAIWFFLLRGGGTGSATLNWREHLPDDVLHVGMDASYPPFDMIDEEGNFSGYDVDLALKIGERLGVPVEFVNTGFDGLYDALYMKRYDVIISALPFDEHMTQDLAYTHKYFDAGEVLVVAKDNVTITKPADLAGKRVAVELGSGGDMQARRLQQKYDFTIVPFYSPEETLRAVPFGQADAAISDNISAFQFSGTQDGIKVLDEMIHVNAVFVIAGRPENKPLIKRIDKEIAVLQEEGFFTELANKWLYAR